MKTKIVISLILSFLLGVNTFAQNDHSKGLVLKRFNSGGGIYVDDANTTVSEYLRMELTNTGKEPIIIFNPHTNFGNWKSKVDLSGILVSNDYQKVGTVTRSFDIKQASSEELKELAKNLDREKPPENLIYILDPGESVQFIDNFEIKVEGKKGYFYNFYNNTIEYKVSLINYHPDPDLLEKLQKRWRKYGYLPLNKNGEFSITSEKL